MLRPGHSWPRGFRLNAYLSAARWLEEFYKIARRITQQNLRAARPDHNIVSEFYSSGTQACDLGREIVDDEWGHVSSGIPWLK
jgi:hypothetical protein